MVDVIKINRAPVLTLWAAVVAKRLGFDWQEALTLGRAVAGLNAYSKGVSLGLYKPTPEAERARRRQTQRGKTVHVDLLHRVVPAVQSPEGLRALSNGHPISSPSVERYVETKFGERFDDARKAMEQLAGSYSAGSLPSTLLSSMKCSGPQSRRAAGAGEPREISTWIMSITWQDGSRRASQRAGHDDPSGYGRRARVALADGPSGSEQG